MFFQLAFTGLMVILRQGAAKAERWTIHTKDVIARAEGCRFRLYSIHGLIQGFHITNEPSFEQGFLDSSKVILDELSQLRSTVSDNPAQVRLADRISWAISGLLDFFEENRRIIVEARMTPERASSRRIVSQRMLDELNQDFELLLREERALDEHRRERLKRSWASLNRLLIWACVTAVVSTVILAVLFSRNIAGRIAVLTENVRRLGAGDQLRPMISGNDEITRLDRAFREMAESIEAAKQREAVHAEHVRRRAEELTHVNAELREKAQENEMFIYSVSHDLRSPLVNLQGFSKELDLIGKDLARIIDVASVPAEIRAQGRRIIDVEMAESIGFIQTAVTRLAAIIDALLRLSRAGRVEYRHQEVDLADVVARVVLTLRGSIEERRAEVVIGELPAVWGDQTAIEQVFANLIGNAVNYLDPTRPGRIEVEMVVPPADGEPVPPGLNVYAVRDNGLGIADAHKPKIFSAFQRLHRDSAKGEGIGLTLVKRMVERHGGRIWFESGAGRGTTFYVALPAFDGQSPPRRGRGPHPLTIDDPENSSEVESR